MIKEIYIELCLRYCDDKNLIEQEWNYILKQYASRKRYYHNSTHLRNLIQELEAVKDKINNWDMVLFSVFYHDLIYNSTKQNNELLSADKAISFLNRIKVNKDLVRLCDEHILATKSHNAVENNDTNYFTDADISILGKPWLTYETYYKNIRLEYAMYEQNIYNEGRKKVLQYFLGLEKIYKTEYFFKKYETQARENLMKEMDILNRENELLQA